MAVEIRKIVVDKANARAREVVIDAACDQMAESAMSIFQDPALSPETKQAMLIKSGGEFVEFLNDEVPDFDVCEAFRDIVKVVCTTLEKRATAHPDYRGTVHEATSRAEGHANLWRKLREEVEERAALEHAMEKNPNIRKDEAPMNATKQDAYAAIDGIAKTLRKPDEAHVQAYARILKTDALARSIYEASTTLPAAQFAGSDPSAVAKRVAQATAVDGIKTKVAEMRKNDPGMSWDQAMTKVYREMQAA